MILGYDPLIIFGLGLVVLCLGWAFVRGKNGKAMKFIGAIICIAAILVPGGLYPVSTPTTTTTTTAAGCPAGWEFTMNDQAASAWPNLASTWDPGDTSVTMAQTINEGGTTHFAFVYNSTEVNITVAPIPGTGAKDDDVYTLYFESDDTIEYSGVDVTAMTGNVPWINISKSGTKYGTDGQVSLKPTSSPVTLHFRYRFGGATDSNGAAYYMSTVGNSVTWNIRFWDNCGHSYTYPVTLFIAVSA